MKIRLLLILIFFQFASFYGQNFDSLIKELDKTLDKKNQYIEQKENFIENIKKEMRAYQSSHELKKQLLTSLKLVYEYQSFIYDSAHFYVSKAKDLSYQLNDNSLIAHVKIQEGFVLLSSGLFKEAIDTLKSVNTKYLDDSLKTNLYSTLARANYDYADFIRNPVLMPRYTSRGNIYLDSAIIYVKHNTNEYWAIESLQRMKKADWRGAKNAFEYWMKNFDLPRHYYAIATSSLGYIYQVTGYPELAIEYLTRAAIADIKTATMETVALRNLASLLYQNGEEKKAYRFIIEALYDATFYNARHRQLETGLILPIIEGERMAVIRNQRDRIITFTILISILLLAFIIAIIIIWISLVRLKKARIIIQESNSKLLEANKIKDEYIAYFFNQNSIFIEKLEKFQKWVKRQVAAKQYNSLKNFPENMDIDEERIALFERFDQIFLKLFPNFVEEFNKLLKPDEQIQLKENQLLSTDLRIYALIRLGINDNEQIASFLNFSVNTVYTYKTKIKSKANCPSDQFKRKVMEIKSI